MFQNQVLKDTENILPHQGPPESLDLSRSPCCDSFKHLQATERNYHLKLAAAQLQLKEYKKNLAEESRKATQWQKRAIVLQSAIRAMKQRGSIPATRKTSTPKTNNLDWNHLDFEDYAEKQIIFWFGCNCIRISFLQSHNVGYWSIFRKTLYTSVQNNTFDMYIKYSYQLKNTCTIAFHISTNNSEALWFCCFYMMVHQINKTKRQVQVQVWL